ncbi:hypothetical protein ISN45_Aa02g007650 [Arabidopsis thaliana x Arabidopsis arenosa]|uniref:DUF1985 domain-containing protein n=1 Tax=Arabidopsis thaliana x Arabidopsis arenosa TaxID=1240361 RepID=A0A8T2BNX7_9BRAS|nr:hypothetical protein ISN45_Aa02g007650 [Arabidopsis thaliana x Arabidopsis arenosa]
MQRRLLLKEKNLWFTFDSQPMRFSEREFLLTTGVQCDLIDSEMLRKGKAPSKAPYFWTQKEHFTLEQLQKRLFEPNQLHPLDAEEKLSLEFAIYTSQPWGKHAYRVLATSIQRINENTWAKGTYEVKGFAMAILLWAFSAVPSLGSAFATECVTSRYEYPLCLKWETTQTPRFSHVVDVVKKMNSVKVNTVIGNPYEYSYLVASSHEDDIDFKEIVRLVQNGYRLKETDWSAGFIDIFTVLQEIGEQTMNNNLSDSEKLDKILNLLQDFNRRIASDIQEETCARTEESDKVGPNIDGDISVDGDSREVDECGPSRDGDIDVDGDNKEDDECGPSTFEDSIREPNTEDGSYAGDDENSQKIRSEDDTAEPTAKDKTPTPNFSTPNFNIISEDSQDCGKDVSNNKKVGESSANKGLPLGDDASQSQSRRKKRKKEDTWMTAGLSLKDLLNTLSTKANAMDPDERVRLGALILVEGILIASNPVNKIEKEHLVRASSFTEFCKYPWARIVYGSLVDCLKKITPTQLFRDQCGLPGFVFAIQIWALTAVAELGQNFGSRVLEPNDNRPLISQWMTTKCPTKKEIANVTQVATFDIKHIIGDPEQYSHLVLPPNPEDKDWFEVFDLVAQGIKAPDARDAKEKEFPASSSGVNKKTEEEFIIITDDEEEVEIPINNQENKQTETREESCSPPDEDSHENVNDEKVAQEEGATDEVPHATEESDPQCSNVNDKVSQKKEKQHEEMRNMDGAPQGTQESDSQRSNVNDKEKQHEEMRNMDGAPQGTQESDSQRSNVNDKVAQTEEAQHNKMGHTEEPSQESDSQQSK